ncbi:MAG TPA: hypothetical protein VEP73_03245 [Actinomycetota bacterium]|nr:hypothetical protein [Actinomycetota bacterium]
MDRKDDAYRRILEWDMPERGDTSAAPAISWAVGLALPVALAAFLVGWLALGWTAHRQAIVWLAALAGPAVGLAVVGVRAGRGPWQRLRTALLAVGAAVLVMAWVVGLLLGSSRPTTVELRSELDHLGVPYASVPGSEVAEGNRFCRRFCVSVARDFRVPRSGQENQVTMFIDALVRAGWKVPPGVRQADTTEVLRGGVKASVGGGVAGGDVQVELTSAG